MVVLDQGGGFGSKVVVFGHMWLCLGKSGCIRAKVVVFVQSGCLRSKWLLRGKVVVFGHSGCIQARWLYLGKSGCVRAKVVVFGEKSL